MIRRIGLLLFSVIILFVLAGCGEKSQSDVVSDLSHKMDEMQGYKTDATMTFMHGQKKQTYSAQIWYKEPSYYKVVLSDASKKNVQVILRNQSGVYVMTPALNKSYRFQSDWPNNRSQYYLFQSLVKDIQKDQKSTMEKQNDAYVFKTKTQYPTKQLSYQTITVDKSSLKLKNVQVMDDNKNVVVDIKFNSFAWDPSFNKSDFDEKQAMTMAKAETPAMAKAATDFKVYYPTADLPKTVLSVMKPEKTSAGKTFVLKYDGAKPFTLIESQSTPQASTEPVAATGEPLNLGFTLAASTDNSLKWSQNGMDFFLVSNDLTTSEMQSIAESVNGQIVK